MNENGTLDDRYLEWLYGLVGAVSNRNPDRSYWNLAKQLYTKPFTWFVANDDNRAEDGRDLRYEFLADQELDRDRDWLELDCSIFEMLIALSRRMAFEADGDALEWFWRFIQNLDIYNYTDSNYNIQARDEIEYALDRLVNRSYSPDGRGGLFPLRRSTQDQRKVELWYQMASYVMEREE